MSLAPVSLAGIHTTTERSTTRLELPSLAKEGAKREPDRAKHQEMLRPLRKCCAASLAGADGVVGSSHRLSEVERTTPFLMFRPTGLTLRAAPFKGTGIFLDGASTPPLPRRGVCSAQAFSKNKCVYFPGISQLNGSTIRLLRLTQFPAR